MTLPPIKFPGGGEKRTSSTNGIGGARVRLCVASDPQGPNLRESSFYAQRYDFYMSIISYTAPRPMAAADTVARELWPGCTLVMRAAEAQRSAYM